MIRTVRIFNVNSSPSRGHFWELKGGGLEGPLGPRLPPQLPVTTQMHYYTYIYKHTYKCTCMFVYLKSKERIEFMPRSLSRKTSRMHQHKYCKLVFVAGASCIRKQFLHIDPACGFVKCTADKAVLEPVLDEMRAWAGWDESLGPLVLSKAAAAQRQLDSITAAAAPMPCHHLGALRWARLGRNMGKAGGACSALNAEVFTKFGHF